MNKREPIFVQLDMRTDLDTLWEHTQVPRLHEQWDLRFSEIRYLPRSSEEEPQHFAYRTRIGFGLDIAGTGATRSAQTTGGDRVSTLEFGSEQPISLICRGSGYWRYHQHPGEDCISFSTRFDYETRFGKLGYWLDRVLFRPLFGWATAWSFDVLRIWIEQRIPPSITIRDAVAHYVLVLLVGLLWCYQGLMPKLLYPDSGELALLTGTGWATGYERQLLNALGWAQVIWGLLVVLLHRKRWVYIVSALAIMGLTFPAIWTQPELLQQPFQPLTTGLAMLGCCLAASRALDRLPHAGRCKRQADKGKRGGGDSDAIHLSTSAGG
ncbi:DoxX-like family protein [Paenibacillus daejeonensis]|uniref:DoxX-like family protein n=1 Tax=Paenibacillus daejeonensis TaxID=135193 RepID=UPI0003652F76|nr:DoxX-like family protein [Paenibacillus daejeonensis]